MSSTNPSRPPLRTSDVSASLAQWWTATTSPAASRLSLALTVATHALALVVGVWFALKPLGVLRHAAPQPVLYSHPRDGKRFGLDEATRRAVFATVAREEPAARRRSVVDFPNHAWSQEDDRGALERNTVESVAATRHLSYSQVQLIMDEGIRAHWLTPDGRPLRDAVTPLEARHR